MLCNRQLYKTNFDTYFQGKFMEHLIFFMENRCEMASSSLWRCLAAVDKLRLPADRRSTGCEGAARSS